MKPWLAAAALVSLWGCAGVSIQPVRVYRVEPREASELLRNRDCFVLDARAPQ